MFMRVSAAGLAEMWDWLGGLTQGQASFLGSMVGALTGLIALLLGALFNARLNRRRDDRLRKEDRRAVATALRAELAVLNDGLQSHVEILKGLDALKDPDEGFNVPDLGQQLRVMPELVSKFGLLNRTTIQRVIEAYGLVEEHYGKLLILEGGKVRVDLSSGGRHVVWLPPRQAPTVLKINADLSEEIQRAIDRLDAYLRMR
jgi:hypothetical protein